MNVMYQIYRHHQQFMSVGKLFWFVLPNENYNDCWGWWNFNAKQNPTSKHNHVENFHYFSFAIMIRENMRGAYIYNQIFIILNIIRLVECCSVYIRNYLAWHQSRKRKKRTKDDIALQYQKGWSEKKNKIK